jgi:hypothetical protein
MRKILISGAIAVAAIATPVLAGAAGASAATNALTASTSVTNRDDSGIHGDVWATDNYTRTVTITGHGVVAATHCPGITAGKSCRYMTGTVQDKGTYTTVPGGTVPGNGSLNGGPAPAIGAQVTGPLTGHFSYQFYTDAPITSASASNVPATADGNPPSSPSTGKWVELFYPAGVNFWDTSGSTGGSEYLGTTGAWTYTAPLGSDTQCPNVSGRWIDASYNGWGTDQVAGNILAPDSGHC